MAASIPRTGRLRLLTNTWLLNALPFILLIIVWHLITYTGAIDAVFLPPPARVLGSFAQLLSKGFLAEHLLPSMVRVGGAFILSIAIALPLGVLAGQVLWVRRLVEPICGFTRYLPVAALVPLCILWFGISDGQKIAVITLGIVFQLVLLFAFDTASVPKELIEAGRTFGLSRAQTVWRIVLPSSMPTIWDDMRISAGWAWSYLVLSELVAGNKGVGYFIIQSQRYLETDRVFAGILFIGILGVITDLLFRVAASKLFKWV
jgi:NitT/TauT family transport system permease protein